MVDSAYSYSQSARRQLTINTNHPLEIYHHSTTQLLSPPESANSGRRNSCWSQDVYQNTSPSFHPDTPVQQLVSQENITLDPNNPLRIYANMEYEDVRYHMPTPSSGDFGYTNDPCSSPGYQSPLSRHLLDHKPSHDHSLSFYTESSSLMSTSQDSQGWDTTHLSQQSIAEATLSRSFGGLYMVPSEGSSFISTQTTGFDPQPSCIAPIQAIHDPSQDFAMSLNESPWSTFQNTSHDSDILTSSSPSLGLSITATTFDEGSIYCKSESSPEPTKYHRPLTRTSTTTKTRREKKQTRRQRQIVQTRTINNIEVAYADERAHAKAIGGEIVRRKTFVCTRGCDKQFERAEHRKRHELTHSGEHPFQCLVTDCNVGTKGDGSQNRKDNSRCHAWTHLKAYLHNDALVQQIRASKPGSRHRNNPRNKPMSPQTMRALASSRYSEDVVKTLLKFMNNEAGRELGVHIQWDVDGCPTVRCVGWAMGCTMCRDPTKKQKKGQDQD